MNTLFEGFVFKMIERALPEFDVEYQRKLRELVMGSDDEYFSLKPTPDITILDNGKIKLIIDAKYKGHP